jgi:hypothetical protein
LPALLLAGLTPVEAIATNKLQGTFGVAASSYTFWRAGHSDLAALRLAIPAAAAGAAIGSILVGQLDPALLKILIPALLIVIEPISRIPRAAPQPAGAQHTRPGASPPRSLPRQLHFRSRSATVPGTRRRIVLHGRAHGVGGARLCATSAIHHGGVLIRPMIVIVTVLIGAAPPPSMTCSAARGLEPRTAEWKRGTRAHLPISALLRYAACIKGEGETSWPSIRSGMPSAPTSQARSSSPS